MMKILTFSTTFFTFASIALKTNADCLTEINSATFQKFISDQHDEGTDDSFPDLCEGLEGDAFTFSGTTKCGEQIEKHFHEYMCLPTSCVKNEADVAALIPYLIYDDPNLDCTGEYTFDGLGDDTPGSMQCIKDFETVESLRIMQDFSEIYVNETGKRYTEDCIEFGHDAPSRCTSDYSKLQSLCTTGSDMDYFTFNVTICHNIDQTSTYWYPMCLPSSCTSDTTFLEWFLTGEVPSEDKGEESLCDKPAFKFNLIGDPIPPQSPESMEIPSTSSSGNSFTYTRGISSILVLATSSLILRK